jgi:hypothetical protein
MATMKLAFCACAALAALTLSGASAFAQQPRQPGAVPVADKVFDWFPKEAPLKDRRIYVEVEILTESTAHDQYDRLTGQNFRYGERFGNKVGNLIPVRFRIFLVKPPAGGEETTVQFAALSANPPRLTLLPVPNQDWHVANQAVLPAGEQPVSIVSVPNVVLDWGGKEYQCSQMIQVTALVQTFKDPRFRLNLWLEFTYAMSRLPGGGPDWRPLETPDFWVDLSSVADPGPQLSTGNTDEVEQLRPVMPAFVLIGVGALFALTPLIYWVTRFARRNLASVQALDPAEQLWRTLKPILSRSIVDNNPRLYRISNQDVAAIVTAIGVYVFRTDGVPINAWTVEELLERQDEIADGEQWYALLKPLKRRVVQLGKRLTPEAYGRIIAQIRQVCPEV